MATHKPLPRLLCYDIADPGRLGRVHRLVRQHGQSLQYSVYFLHADAAQLHSLCEALEEIIDPRQDDIRIYPLQPGAPARTLGHHGLETLGTMAGIGLPPELGGIERSHHFSSPEKSPTPLATTEKNNKNGNRQK